MAFGPNDEQILRLIKRDSNAGMDMLVEMYGALAAHIIRRRISSVCSEYDVEECVAETFVDLYTQLDRIDLRKGSLKGYISVIARRRAADRFEQAVKENGSRSQIDESYFGTIPDDSPSPETTAARNETSEQLMREVNRLGEPDSEILYRRYYLEQSLGEIAEALGMKRPTVSKRIERALGKLKVSMEGYI